MEVLLILLWHNRENLYLFIARNRKSFFPLSLKFISKLLEIYFKPLGKMGKLFFLSPGPNLPPSFHLSSLTRPSHSPTPPPYTPSHRGGRPSSLLPFFCWPSSQAGPPARPSPWPSYWHFLALLKSGCHPQHNTKRYGCTYDHSTIENE